jgi:hypothetical protein
VRQFAQERWQVTRGIDLGVPQHANDTRRANDLKLEGLLKRSTPCSNE